jgi:hypothetical protein
MANAVPPPIDDGQLPFIVPMVICPGADLLFAIEWLSDYGGLYHEPVPVDFTGAQATLKVRSVPSAPSPLLSVSTASSSQGLIQMGTSYLGAGVGYATSPNAFTATLSYQIAEYDWLIQWANGQITEFARGPVIIAPVGIIRQDEDLYQYADWSDEWIWYGQVPENPQPIDLSQCTSALGVRATTNSTTDLLDISTIQTSQGGIVLGGTTGSIADSINAVAGVDTLPVNTTPFWQQFLMFSDGTKWCWATGGMRIHPGNDY